MINTKDCVLAQSLSIMKLKRENTAIIAGEIYSPQFFLVSFLGASAVEAFDCNFSFSGAINM